MAHRLLPSNERMPFEGQPKRRLAFFSCSRPASQRLPRARRVVFEPILFPFGIVAQTLSWGTLDGHKRTGAGRSYHRVTTGILGVALIQSLFAGVSRFPSS
jgi:hypothetical protein